LAQALDGNPSAATLIVAFEAAGTYLRCRSPAMPRIVGLLAFLVLAAAAPRSLRRSAHHGLRPGEGAASINRTETVSGAQNLVEAGRKPKIKASRTWEKLLWDGDSGGHRVTRLKCGVTEQVHSASNKWEVCPEECPLFAEHVDDGIHCDFRCVPATVEACTEMNPKEPIPDDYLGYCRTCMVHGCKTCATDGTDTCSECSHGYYLNENGRCRNEFFWVGVAIFLFCLLLVGIVVTWVVSLARRPITNQDALNQALDHRSRSKLRMPRSMTQGRPLWPILTNLMRKSVAGPGIVLDFNFQFAIIAWASLMAISWQILASSVDSELLSLGTHRAESKRQNCIVVAFGYEAQKALMPYKVYFLFVAYAGSFLLAILFSMRQRRIFFDIDEKTSTHKDFCARIWNLPTMDGTELVEQEIKRAVADVVGDTVIGVSVCWDFAEQADVIQSALEKNLSEVEAKEIRARNISLPRESTEALQMPVEQARSDWWVFEKLEGLVFGSDTKEALDDAIVDEPKDTMKPEDYTKVCHDLKTSGQAFVVFQSESSRNAALEKVAEVGLTFRDTKIEMEEAVFEPASVNWANCVPMTFRRKVKLIAGGVSSLVSAMGIWVFCFYAPYAYFIMSFNYSYGQEPGMIANLAFTVVVVMGNGLMYYVCSEISDRVGFQVVDNREVCYMLLYSFACMTNVLLDMVVTYYMAYWMMVGVDMRTYHGTPLAEVDTFTERFETYAMQRALGQNLMAYSFPSTFLVPFVIEPFVTIFLPFKLMSYIVRSHGNIKPYDAEKFMTPLPMDLSRYADVMLNVMLAALVFYFPGGFTHRMFWALAFSHLVIYICDQYKVLRCIPSCYFASLDVDWWAQWMLSIPCALMLASTVFKMNCMEGHDCVGGYYLIVRCSMVFVAHMVLHTWVLVTWVPTWVKQATALHEQMPYKKCARMHAMSWFATNPVHCLRSQYIYGHSPPCDFCLIGKEHLLRVNPKENFWFKDTEAEVEDYTSANSFTQSIRKSWAGMTEEVREKGMMHWFTMPAETHSIHDVKFYDDTPPVSPGKAHRSLSRSSSEPPSMRQAGQQGQQEETLSRSSSPGSERGRPDTPGRMGRDRRHHTGV